MQCWDTMLGICTPSCWLDCSLRVSRGRSAVAWLGCRARRSSVYFLTLPPTMPPAQAAAAAAEAERAQRAEAQGQSEQLRAESERRARVFNAAVQKAVSKIQQELEAERDMLQQR